MTAPTPENPATEQPAPPRRYRPGQIITYRVRDSITGDDLSGHALVLKVNGDTVDLATLGVGHIQTHVDNVTPAKPEDVPNPLPAPVEDATGSD